MSFGAVGKGCDVRLEDILIIQFNCHGAIIVKRSLVDGKIVTVGRAERKWGVNGILKIVNGGFFVIIFVAIWLISGDFPSQSIEI